MQLIVASDIHSRFKETMKKIQSLAIPDIFLFAGDMTNFGEVKEKAQLEGFLIECSKLAPVFWICGNHDINMLNYSVNSLYHPVSNITDKIVSFKKYSIIGMNMSPCYDIPTLANYWERMTASKEVEKAYYEKFIYADIVISHCPPEGKLAVTSQNEQIGSSSLKEYINMHQPKLVVCGHVHEQKGKVDYIDNTKIVNTATTVLEVELD